MKNETLQNRILEAWQKEKSFLLLCFAAVFCWGLAAHAYGFFRASFSHDMLNALVVTDVETYWKMQLGRPGIILYRRIVRGLIAAPWLLGLLSLVWLSLACWLTAKLFRLQRPLFVVLLAGLLTVNLSVIAMTATYLYEADADLFAMLLGICAVWLWDRRGLPGSLLGILFIAACMGTYQSLLSVPITLIMLLSMTALLRGEAFRDVFRKGLRGILMLTLGALLYWLLIRLMCTLKGINLTPDSYNSLQQTVQRSVPERILQTYGTWAAAFLAPGQRHIELPVLLVNILLPLLFLLRLFPWFGDRNIGIAEKLLFLVLLLLLPLGMNTAQLAFSREVHELMEYAFWFFPLLCLLPFFLLPAGFRSRLLASLLALVFLCSHVQTANIVYTKKQLEQDACLSLMTRVLSRLEALPDYRSGETPLVFVGVSNELQEKLPGFEAYYDIDGCEEANPLVKSDTTYYYNTYAAYLRYLLNSPAVPAETGIWTALQRDPRVQTMPCYPEDGCMQLLDGIYVIKLGEPDT